MSQKKEIFEFINFSDEEKKDRREFFERQTAKDFISILSQKELRSIKNE